MKIKTPTVIFSWMLICLVGPIFIYGQDNEIDLRNKRITLKMEKVYFGTVLGYLMENYDIPIGFEQSILDRKDSESRFDANTPGIAHYPIEKINEVFRIPEKSGFKAPANPVTIDVENERLKDVLNKIVRQIENYKWEINDGVVNIYPVKGRDQKFKRLLNLKIKKFKLEKGKPISEITKNIKTLPEFISFISANNLHFSGAKSGPESVLRTQYGRKLDEGMDFSNLRFRDLLNKITKVKRGGWILRFRFISEKMGEEYLDIDI